MVEIVFLEWPPDSFHVCAYSWMPVCLICFPGLYSILVLAGLGACCPTLFTSWCRGWFRSAWCGTACWGWSCCVKSTSCHCGKRCPASRSCWPSGCWAAGSRSDLRTLVVRQSTSGGRTRPWCIPAQKLRLEGFISAATVPADAASAPTTVWTTPGESDRWAYEPLCGWTCWSPGFMSYFFNSFFHIWTILLLLSALRWDSHLNYIKFYIQEKIICGKNAPTLPALNNHIISWWCHSERYMHNDECGNNTKDDFIRGVWNVLKIRSKLCPFVSAATRSYITLWSLNWCYVFEAFKRGR